MNSWPKVHFHRVFWILRFSLFVLLIQIILDSSMKAFRVNLFARIKAKASLFVHGVVDIVPQTLVAQ